jgi:hypothetical protein
MNKGSAMSSQKGFFTELSTEIVCLLEENNAKGKEIDDLKGFVIAKDREIDTLKAQVNDLREALMEARWKVADSCFQGDIDEALKKTPEQSLIEHELRAIAEYEADNVRSDQVVLDAYQIACLAESVGLTVQCNETGEDFWGAEVVLTENFTLVDEDTGGRELVDVGFWFAGEQQEGAFGLWKFCDGFDTSCWRFGAVATEQLTPELSQNEASSKTIGDMPPKKNNLKERLVVAGQKVVSPMSKEEAESIIREIGMPHHAI